MQDLLYIKANAVVPEGVISSTARRGVKWSEQAKAGDVVHLKVLESQVVFGQAAITKVEVMSYSDVIANARSNHVLWKAGSTDENVAHVLAADLKAAYDPDDKNPIKADEPFTVLSLIPIRL